MCKLQNINDKSKNEEIAYGIELLLSTIISVVIVTIISLAIGRLVGYVALMVFFIPLKFFWGVGIMPPHVLNV